MAQRWAITLILVLAVLSAPLPVNAESQGSGQTSPTQNVPTSISGTITTLDVSSLSPSLTVADSSGKIFPVWADSATTVSTSQGQKGYLSDLKIGQQVQIGGRYMAYAGSFTAESITITQQPTAPTPPPSASTAPVSSANTKSSSLPRVLKSIPDAEKQAQTNSAPSGQHKP